MSRAARIPVYRGHFGPDQAERLLWRAGFGPRPGEEKRLAKKGARGVLLEARNGDLPPIVVDVAQVPV